MQKLHVFCLYLFCLCTGALITRAGSRTLKWPQNKGPYAHYYCFERRNLVKKCYKLFVDKVKKQLLHVLFSFKTQAGDHGGCSLLLQTPVFERKREGEKGPKNSVQESKQNKTKSVQETKKGGWHLLS